ncbi:MAG TPA: hypothetical protein ENK55_04675 [Actinobacteria bacterium]|nr:hypothetical protein [Actinomycetota bacterium]
MRILLDGRGEVATRAGWLLLGERDLERLGLWRRRPRGDDRRLAEARTVEGFDVVVTDAEDPGALVALAGEAGVPAVVWVDAIGAHRGDTPVLVGANVGSGLAPALAAHESANAETPGLVEIAWTEPGRPLRRGHAVRFPEPVGPRWARERRRNGHVRYFAAPTPGEWAGVLVRMAGVSERIVGVADLAVHLEALSLAAGALVAAAGALRGRRGVVTVAEVAEAYLDVLLELGLEVAEWRSH